MKTQIFLFICSIYAISAAAQQYVPFPMKNAVWNSGWYYQKFDAATSNDYSTYTEGDTIINNLNYAKLYQNEVSKSYVPPTVLKSTTTYLHTYIGAIREESKRVYFFPRAATNEYLLYDFSGKVGDTLFTKVRMIVGRIDSVKLSDGTFRKRFICPKGSFPVPYYIIIEGIGAIELDRDAFQPFVDFIYQYPRYLNCMLVDGKVIYGGTAAGSCDFVSNNADELVQPNFVQLSNTTLKDAITVSFESRNLQLQLFNSLGQVSFQSKLDSSPYRFEKGNLSSGIYFLHCRSENGLVQVYKILVE